MNAHRPPAGSDSHAAMWILVIAIASFVGCDFPGKPNAGDRPVSPENVLNFQAIYKRNCAGCHGSNGKLGAAPPLNDPLFRALVPESELERVVSAGRPGTPMPVFAHANGGPLTPAQIQVLVRGIKSATQWGEPKPLPKNVPAYLLSKRASNHTSVEYEQIRKAVFARACAGCHGDHGQGDASAGAINDPSFLALISNQVLRRLTITGRSDLGMPDYAGTDGRDPDFRPLSSREIDELVELLASWRTRGTHDGDHERQTARR